MPNPFNNSNNSQFLPNIDLLKTNPMFQMLKGNGMSYEQMVRYLCKQRGIDVNQLLEQAKQLK